MEPHLNSIVPLIQLKSGIFKFKAKDYHEKEPMGMFLSKDHLKLYFKIPVIKKKKVEQYVTLECLNVTAADLRVANKYGSWSSLKCHLIIECRKPLFSYTQGVITNSVESETENTGLIHVKEQESCMVQASFDVENTGQVRNILTTLKTAQSHKRKNLKDSKIKNVDIPPKVREGLPIWVKYVPAQWYSNSIRKVLERVIFVYTVLTILWAFWQLYKNVHFVRHYIQPIIIWIETYFALLKAWISAIDSFLITMTDWWWKKMKPMYVLIAPIYLALSQLFAPLRNIGEVIATVLTPLFQSFGLIFQQFKLLISPVIQLGISLKQSIVRIFSLFLNNSILNPLWQRLSNLGIVSFLRETQLGVLDPLKSHMVLVQQTLMRSANQIIKGIRFLFINIRSVCFFAQQERNHAQEPDVDEQNVKPKED